MATAAGFDIDQPGSSKLSPSVLEVAVSRIKKAEEYKEAGNVQFKAKNFKGAIGKYHRALLSVKDINKAAQSNSNILQNILGMSNGDVDGLGDGQQESAEGLPDDLLQTVISVEMSCHNNLADGCAGQYKNCKHFLNLCYHQGDFGMDCSWSFFATSHGKFPCDGVGGTVKRLTTRASLQRPSSNQIMTTLDMFKFCEEEISWINFLYITKDEMVTTRNKLLDRFTNATTIPGTRGFHHFSPKSSTAIAAKRDSSDETNVVEFDFSNNEELKLKIQASDTVICQYDAKYWIGLVCELNSEERDICMKFMHPNYPFRSFKWPLREDECWVPETDILCTLKPLITATDRQYHMDDEDKARVMKIIHV